MPTLDCVEDLAELGETVLISTAGKGQDFPLSCRAGNGDDVAYELQVPATDYYVFRTRDSGFDTALALFDDTCDGAELVCNDNVGTTLQSEIVRQLAEGDRVVVVASGSGGENGELSLSVDRVRCPELDLSDQPLPTTKNTVGGPNEHSGSCGGDGHPERAYRFVPAADGLYRFSVSTEVFDPAIYLEVGPVCGGELLGCGYARKGEWPAEITRYLTAGVAVTAIVDGRDGSGLFELNVEAIAGACPSGTGAESAIEPTVPHLLSTSCDETGGQDFSGYRAHSDRSVLLEHSIGFGGGCTYYVLSSLPVAVSLLRGASCAGEEITCVPSTDLGDGMSPRYEASFDLGHDDNGDYVIVIESPQTQATVEYAITMSCVL
jgi:hypothetical protein